MSKIPTSLGHLIEGHIRKEGSYQIEQPDGSLVDLEEILDAYQDQEVRFTLVSLRELEDLKYLIKQQ